MYLVSLTKASWKVATKSLKSQVPGVPTSLTEF